MSSIRLTVPLPPRECHPNARPHYMAKAKATKRYRGEVSVIASMVRPAQPFAKALCELHYFTKTAAVPDSDNLISWAKALFDGLADAGIVTNDRRLTHAPAEWSKDRENPRVEVTLTEIE